MSLFLKPDHAANPPETWIVVKAADRCWHLRTKDGVTISSEKTKRAAEALRVEGFYVDLYAKEGRWYAGESVPGWKPYAECVPMRERFVFVYPPTPIGDAIESYGERIETAPPGTENQAYSAGFLGVIYGPRVQELLDLQAAGFVCAQWGRAVGEDTNRWFGCDEGSRAFNVSEA